MADVPRVLGLVDQREGVPEDQRWPPGLLPNHVMHKASIATQPL